MHTIGHKREENDGYSMMKLVGSSGNLSVNDSSHNHSSSGDNNKALRKPNQIAGDGSDSKQIISQLTDLAMTNYVFKTILDTKEIYRYNFDLGIYINDGEAVIEKLCEIEDEQVLTSQVNEVKNHIRRRTLTDRNEFKSTYRMACMQQLYCKFKNIRNKTQFP